jgi:hypothetical protein
MHPALNSMTTMAGSSSNGRAPWPDDRKKEDFIGRDPTAPDMFARVCSPPTILTTPGVGVDGRRRPRAIR